MSLSLRKNSSGGTVGLDIDGRYLAAAQVESGRVVRGASLELPEGLVRDGEVVDRDGLAEALKNFVAEAGLPKSVRLGVANQQIVVRVVELPRIEDEKQRDAAVRFQAAEAIAMPLDEAVLDHQVASYTEAPDGSPRMQVVLVAARRSMIEAVLEAAKQAGLKPEGIDLDAFALVRTLASASEADSDDSARVYCHLGGVSNLAIAVGTACFFTRPLSAVWDDEDAGARLADEIRLSIDYYMTQAQAKPVGEVVLSGVGSVDDELVESLGVHLGLPTTVAAPLGVLDPDGARGRRGSAPPDGGRRTRDGEGRMKAVNLIPSDQRRAKASGNVSGGAYGVLGVLAVLLVMAVAYVMTSNSVNDSKSKAAQARQEADAAETQSKQLGAFTDFASIKEQRLTSVMAAAQTRFDWERFMRELVACDAGGQLGPHHERFGGRRPGGGNCRRGGRANRSHAQGQPRRLHAAPVRGRTHDGAPRADVPRDGRRL